MKAAKTSQATPMTAERKSINLALQGGGAHGAFGWGVMDKFLEDGRIEIEGISGTSAGSMNAVVYAFGKIKGNDGARAALHDFWKAISDAGQKYAIKPTPFDALFGGNMLQTMVHSGMKMLTDTFSPYQLNPHNANPLRAVLEAQVDFEALDRLAQTKLFICATNVRTGKAKVFHTDEISADVVLASACLPQLFQAVQIGDEHYWDGGYMGNPVLYPLFYHTDSRDVVIVHINPIERPGVPTTAGDIANRLNEITFNAALMKELRAVYFVQKMMDDGWIKDEYLKQMKYVLIHSVRADQAMSDLSAASKMDSDWDFLCMLRDRGRACASAWLKQHFNDLNQRSSVDLEKEFM
ncbi:MULTISPECIES: patatin-like phospholipase family protein [unclassified Undibacterium]|uniref:patatin-like phospholipase family protein n=1 Tax=unclassified Undibacterium TaxID=2630295 RepID=UPI002AC9585A|nr:MULTISPECIES: patatin-like phospholipase family protein [unclassified Undibacterium]MEB0140076.1 patatin-like phospholipase family protein [Undibacterium sp. CCC2.1]MEB0173186.1 patatin-like phospholipase family protein [Undibacterium sp. CCC1.1]MEB0176887.1 patatin-like phospholipase family protein [Undibacterium sp. CCC3.4]MEB0216200.1 patatin-like phospholipase family protein [Undibacterium sp. 5I2]WPX41958.1 patatin-like phospholipase family protein [Undibacterium sp. CCC3.4]